jgi:hypothetical protein
MTRCGACQEALEFEFLEGQAGDVLDQHSLLIRRDEIGPVPEPLGELCLRRVEQISVGNLHALP